MNPLNIFVRETIESFRSYLVESKYESCYGLKKISSIRDLSENEKELWNNTCNKINPQIFSELKLSAITQNENNE